MEHLVITLNTGSQDLVWKKKKFFGKKIAILDLSLNIKP